MNTVAIIPARFASSRFPGKPLIDIAGQSMIMRVYKQARKASMLNDVMVATDDQRIYDHVKEAGGKVLMTADHHRSGTERIAEVAARLPDAQLVINLQGDEPFIDPEAINLLVGLFQNQPETRIATLAHSYEQEEEFNDPNIVKVVFNRLGKALYFSRSAIPYTRNESLSKKALLHRHLGIYAFRTNVLLEVALLPPSPLEQLESLEQLRWLDHGYPIQVVTVAHAPIAIDTPDDLKQLQRWLKENPHILE